MALVVGGGSGHYPTFLGYVGSGLADGAVAGTCSRHLDQCGGRGGAGGGPGRRRHPGLWELCGRRAELWRCRRTSARRRDRCAHPGRDR
ncbi:dihydroxyacetone kinase subunit DhaK [Paracoccus marcusii]|uniref:dihydroxyacetone kinase subunit DhaK n=1 Tax=Paracoccus marcusii TaxID=59779 RepID=UPI002ED3E0B0|nr:dihydroxyacetone kinase subunit DhaK [Paracoccus marcusii]